MLAGSNRPDLKARPLNSAPDFRPGEHGGKLRSFRLASRRHPFAPM